MLRSARLEDARIEEKFRHGKWSRSEFAPPFEPPVGRLAARALAEPRDREVRRERLFVRREAGAAEGRLDSIAEGGEPFLELDADPDHARRTARRKAARAGKNERKSRLPNRFQRRCDPGGLLRL